jgi:hypothetical protein
MTDAGGEEYDNNNGEPMSANGLIANGGNRAEGGGEGGGSGGRGGGLLRSFSRYNGLLYQYNMRRKCPPSHLRWPSGPTSIKTRPHIVFFCISE